MKKSEKPNYIQLRNILSKMIWNKKHGEKIPSIRILMKTYEASQSTVNKALVELENASFSKQSA